MKRMLMTVGLMIHTLLIGTTMAVEPVGQIINLSGQAMVIGTDGQMQRLVMKSEVYLQDRIETKEGAKLQIMLLDDAVISLGANSSMTIDEFVYSAANQKDNATTLSFLRGVFRVITAKVADINPERFQVKSNMSTVGIRGCELGFTIDEDKENVQVVHLPETKYIRFESRQGSNTIDVRQQGMTVEIDASGFTKRATQDAEFIAVVDSTTPEVSGDGGPGGVLGKAPRIGEAEFVANVSDVDDGVDVADSGVLLDSKQNVNGEGDLNFVQNIVDSAVQLVSDVALFEASISQLPPSDGENGGDASRIPGADDKRGPGADVLPSFPQEGTPIVIASGSGSDWSWGVWEQTDILNENGDRRVSLTTQLNSQAVTKRAMNNLISGTPVELNGRIVAGAGLTQGNQSALLLSDGGANTFSLIAGNTLLRPVWEGAFSLGNSAGDQLVFRANGNVEANGSFSAQASSYTLQAFGNSYTREGLTGNNIGGTLVGESTVTGASGDFVFRHGSGPRVNGVFGVDFK